MNGKERKVEAIGQFNRSVTVGAIIKVVKS